MAEITRTRLRLDYATPQPPRPVDWHRVVRRAAKWMLLACVFLLGVPAGKLGIAAWQRARLLRLQNACLAWTMPADHVVYADAPADPLVSSTGQVITPLFRPPGFTGVPPCLRNLDAERPWLHYQRETVLFLHERRAVGGEPRLVVVEFYPMEFVPHSVLDQIRAEVRRPERFIPAAHPVDFDVLALQGPVSGTHGAMELMRGPHTRRFFDGQVDPTDASHFTVRYDLDGKEGIIDGWLQPDDVVRFAARGSAADAVPGQSR